MKLAELVPEAQNNLSLSPKIKLRNYDFPIE